MEHPVECEPFAGSPETVTRGMARRAVPIALLVLVLVSAAGRAAAGQFRQLAGLIDTRTTFSDGALSVDALAELAARRGFEVLFLNDHDVLAMAYGLPPLRHVLRVKKKMPALRESGADAYLAAVAAARSSHPDLIIVPGAESVPYYYWSGSYFGGDLTANDHEKRLLAIGLEAPADYERMPVIHNRPSTQHLTQRLPVLLVFSGALLLGVYIATWGRWYRWAGVGVGLAALLMIADAQPFRSSPYDQYMGNLGIAPYQHYIDYVNARGGMVFWNYPETRSGVRPYGPIRLSTPPYPEALLEARDYTGFAAVYGDTITITEPGRVWDRALSQYCRGTRRQPVWGVATADFHEDGGAGEQLGNFPTVFLVTEKSRDGVLEAMRSGRMYAVRARYPQRLVLAEFSVSGAAGDVRGTLGETVSVAGAPRIRFSVSLTEPVAAAATVRVVRGGAAVETLEGPLPLAATVVDEQCPAGEKTFYRLIVDSRTAGKLVANPVFVTRR